MTMNNQQQQKHIKQVIKAELIAYYDRIQFQIDIKAQEMFRKLELSEGGEIERARLVVENEKMLQIVREIFKSNLNRINEFKFDDELRIEDEEIYKEDLKKNLIDNFCFYVENESLQFLNESISDNKTKYYSKRINNETTIDTKLPLGLLLVTDWYLDKNQLDYLRYKSFGARDINHKLNETRCLYFDSDFLNLDFGMLEACRHHKRVGYILYLKKSIIQDELGKVEHLRMQFDSSFARIHLKNGTFQHLGHLKKLTFHNVYEKSKLNEINIDELTFYGLHKLETIKFNRNKFLIQPNTFHQLVCLKEIELNHGELDLNFLNSLEGLDKLILAFNGEDLAKNIRKIKHFNKLKSLELICTDLNQIKVDTLPHMNKLERLDIKANQLMSIEENAFKYLTNLKELYIKSNKLKLIKKKTFNGLTKLECFVTKESVDLIIEEDSFEELINLRRLSVWIDHLPLISNRLLKNLNKLEKLTIHSNKIGKIEQNAFKTLQNLHSLRLNNRDIRFFYDEQLTYLKTLSNKELKQFVGVAYQHEFKIFLPIQLNLGFFI